jgi:L-alanine-DL-glutamate epimerase-like enolase superfamily enzyme
MTTIQSVIIEPVSFRLIDAFITAGGKKTTTQNIQVAVTLSDGHRGYGEASSSIAMPEESQTTMQRVLKDLVPEIRGKEIDTYREVIQACWRLQPYHPTAVAALECAVIDAYTRYRGQPMYQFFGGHSTSVETDITLSIGGPAKLRRAAKAAQRKGFRKFKIKLAGDSAKKDAERVVAVHRAVPRAVLVADGNQGMKMSQALDFLQLLDKAGVQLRFLEQPFPRHDFPSMRQFKRRCSVPLFADESVRTPADALRLFESESVDGVNVKVAKSGLLGCLDIIQVARSFHKGIAIGCMEESKLGLAASVHLACGVGGFDWIDLDSVFLLEKSTLQGGFRTKGPKLSVAGIRQGTGM